jgi:hypothetical protein
LCVDALLSFLLGGYLVFYIWFFFYGVLVVVPVLFPFGPGCFVLFYVDLCGCLFCGSSDSAGSLELKLMVNLGRSKFSIASIANYYLI